MEGVVTCNGEGRGEFSSGAVAKIRKGHVVPLAEEKGRGGMRWSKGKCRRVEMFKTRSRIRAAQFVS